MIVGIEGCSGNGSDDDSDNGEFTGAGAAVFAAAPVLSLSNRCKPPIPRASTVADAMMMLEAFINGQRQMALPAVSLPREAVFATTQGVTQL